MPPPGTASRAHVTAPSQPHGSAQKFRRPLLRSIFRSFADALVSVAIPSDCRICSTALTRASRLPLCDECRLLAPQTSALCACCGEALDMESLRFAEGFSPEEGVLCHPCRVAPPQFERAVAYTSYEGNARTLLHLLKYERMEPVAALLAPNLAAAVMQLRPVAADRLLVAPVPLFAAKQRSRGYNQSDLLAREALKLVTANEPRWQFDYRPDLLDRVRSTASQFELSPSGRRRNLQGAFAVGKNGFRAGTEVLVIDDIYTSGATARECARVLRRAGAARVWIATFARAQRPQVALWDKDAERTAGGFG